MMIMYFMYVVVYVISKSAPMLPDPFHIVRSLFHRVKKLIIMI